MEVDFQKADNLKNIEINSWINNKNEITIHE